MNATNTAKSVRADIWGTRGFPVDPAWIAHQMGLRVLDADLPDAAEYLFPAHTPKFLK